MVGMQYRFLLISLTGAALGIAGILPLMSKPTRVTCSLSPIVTSIGLMIMHVSLHVRITRIYLIFKNDDLYRVKITDTHLYRIMAKYLLLLCGLLAVWVFKGGNQIYVDEVHLSSGHKVTWERCGTNKFSVISYSAGALLFYVILKNCYLAIQIRKIPSKFQDARFVLLAIYTAGLPTMLYALMFSLVGEENVLMRDVGFAIASFVANVLAILWLVIPSLQLAIAELHKKIFQVEIAHGALKNSRNISMVEMAKDGSPIRQIKVGEFPHGSVHKNITCNNESKNKDPDSNTFHLIFSKKRDSACNSNEPNK